MKRITLLFLLAIISACSNPTVDYNYPNDPQNARNLRAGRFFDPINFGGSQVNAKKDPAANSANNTASVAPVPPKETVRKSSALWTSSVEVISGLLPLATADETSGLIITEWYMDGEKKNERIKINLLVKGAEIKDENLVLTIFRQAKTSDGTWVDEQSSERNISTKMIKDKIIQKAQSKQQ